MTADRIESEIRLLVVTHSWSDEGSAIRQFRALRNQLIAGAIADAQFAAHDLVEYITDRFEQMSPADQASTRADYDQLVSDLYCYVGISGKVFELNPGDPEKAFDLPAVGGVNFPANAVTVPMLVALTNISTLPNPLVTDLDTYPGYISIDLFPNTVLSQLATVVLCPSANAPPNVVVGHQDPTVGFELLDPVPVPPLLANTCTTASSQEPGRMSWFERLLAHATDAMLPTKLEAASTMLLGGIGGSTLRFSPFGVVSPTGVGTGGLGGSTLRFARPVDPATAPATGPQASNPPLPTDFVDGTAGATATTNLPFVTIMTPGGDADGANPLANVTVIFTIGAASSYDPDSQAQICDATGTVPASGQVSVKTDPNGVATLPCLKFGTLAGFANLSATFDPTTLGFPNADLVTITAVDGTLTGTSLNWLVQTVAGTAKSIKTYFAPAAPAQSFSYGSNLPVNSDVSPAPQAIVTDAFGNVVASQPVFWSATTTNGGGLTVGAGSTTNANGTAQVTSWKIGEGLNQATASLYEVNTVLPEGFRPAVFTATSPAGTSVFACSVGSSRTDLAPFSIETPNGSVRTVTVWMSVTRRSSLLSAHSATLAVFKGGATGPLVGQGGGTVLLPGINSSPISQTFTLTDPVTVTESQGSSTLWFQLTVATPSNRKVQLWYRTATFAASDPCSDSKIYPTNYPISTSFKPGLSINVTN